MTRLGSGMGFAASSAVTGISTDTTSVEVGAGVTEAARGRSGPTETNLPLGASMACLLLAVGASFAVGLPDMVSSALQSAGKWSGRPHRKQWARWCFLEVWVELSDGRFRFGDEVGGAMLYVTGRVAMRVSAARSRLPKSCDRLRATASRC